MSGDKRDEFVFTWRIENFSFCYQDRGQHFSSPDFTVESLNGSKWLLELYPRGCLEEREERREFLACVLCQDEDAVPYDDVPFEVKIEIIGTGGKILAATEGNYEPTNEYQTESESPMFVVVMKSMQDAKVSAEDILNIRCHFYGKVSENKSFVEREARTKINVHRLVFEMEVLCVFEEDRLVDGDRKRITIPGDDSFECIITGSLDDLNVDILKTESKYKRPHFVECKLTLRGIGERDVYTERATHFFQSENFPEVWQFPLDIICKLAHKRDCRFDAVWFDMIRFHCEFSCSSGSETHEYTVPNNYPTLQEDLCNILLNKTFSDIKLQVNSQSLDAHRSILSARSPVFSVLLHQNMMETRLDIVDTDFDTLKLFLEFLYTDTVKEMDYDRARNLLVTAGKYQVLSLKKKCLGFLKSEISVENVCEILRLADIFSDTHLKSTAIDFIVDNSVKITSSPEWILWMERNPELATEVSTELTSNTKFDVNSMTLSELKEACVQFEVTEHNWEMCVKSQDTFRRH